MKNIICVLTLAVSFIFSPSIHAKKVDVITAQTVAKNCYYEKINVEGKRSIQDFIVNESITISNQAEPVYYVFNINSEGFVIVSADDIVLPIIGYSTEHIYTKENQPENFKSWMKHYENEILYAREMKVSANQEIQDLWSYYLTAPFVPNTETKDSKVITPLLTSTWDQNALYNELCPTDGAGPGGHAYAGCVATSMAQVMFYYRFPATGQGSHSYYSPYGSLSVNPGTTTYNWNGMQNSLSASNLDVAKLIYHCGVTVDMYYSASGSGANMNDALNALVSHFRYSNTMTLRNRSIYTSNNWIALLKTELDAKRPTIYSGDDTGGAGGHAWVCDGYDISNNFHMNWGWSGYYNGYFTLTNLNPGSYNFNNQQSAIVNIYPFSGYPSFCTGQTTITTGAGTIVDGSGPSDYHNNSDCSWLISPTGSPSSIHLSFDNFSTQSTSDVVTVYNGGTISDPVLGTFSGSSLPPSISSTGPQMLVKFTSNVSTTSSGWMASYNSTFPLLCNSLTTLTAASGNFSDGSGASNYNNNTNCKWRIMPPGATSIVLSFSAFNTESNADYVKIYDASVTPSVLLATYSGNSIPASVTCPSNYMLIVFTSNASTTAAGWDAFYNSTTGIEDNELASTLNVFPNPTENNFILSFTSSSAQNITIDMTSVTGQKIMGENLNKFTGSFNKTIDVSGIAKGIYFLRIVTEKGMSNQKIIVE